MVAKLSKNMSFNLDKAEPGLQKVRVRLTWDPSQVIGKFDADLSIAVLAADGVRSDGQPKRIIFAEDERYLIYYNTNVDANGNPLLDPQGQPLPKQTPNGEVRHSGDDRTGADGEQAEINLGLMHEEVAEIAIVGTIFKGSQRNQNWGMLNAKMILENAETNEVLAEYALGKDFPQDTAVHFGSLYRDDHGKWQLKAFGIGYPKVGLEVFIEQWS